MFLEDFRDNDLERSAILVSTTPPTIINIKYDIYAIHAYKFTLECLSDLEISSENLNNGINATSAITMWYLSLNSFIESLYKVLSLRMCSNENYREMSLVDRYCCILSMLSCEISDLERKVLDKLSDFSLIYKNLHLDLNNETKLSFKTANFSPRPFFVNQIDVFQSMMIALEIFEKLRFVISGLDLMPNISVRALNRQVVFEKLSVLHRNSIIPIFRDILSKHKLKTKLNYLEKFCHLPVSNIFEDKQVILIFRFEKDKKYNWKLNSSSTEIISYHYSNAIKKYEGRENVFFRNYLSQQ